MIKRQELYSGVVIGSGDSRRQVLYTRAGTGARDLSSIQEQGQDQTQEQ